MRTKTDSRLSRGVAAALLVYLPACANSTTGSAAVDGSAGDQARSTSLDLAPLPADLQTLFDGDAMAPSDLSTQGDLAPCSGSVAVTPDPINFGTYTIGSTPKLDVQLANPGPCGLTLLGAQLGGQDAAAFMLGDLPQLPLHLAAGMATTMDVTFAAVSGQQAANLTLMTDDPVQPTWNVPITGTGVAGDAMIDISVSSVLFQSVKAGTLSSPQTANISNRGTADLHLFSETVVGTNPGDFLVDWSQVPDTIVPAATFQFSVKCQPPATGSWSAQLKIASDDPINPMITVKLGCIGT